MSDFREFPKMARVFRDVTITEKIDGTNAQVFVGDDGTVRAGSRNRWITSESDNFGFAAWVRDNEEELRTLGPGHHYGEWWGAGIQRRYGLDHRRFSLFNTDRWEESRPACCHVVPVLYRGMFATVEVKQALMRLRELGSVAAPGFMSPEGVIVFHHAARIGMKATIENDDKAKGAA